MTGSARAASTSGGTGVGPGVKRYRLLTSCRLAMAAEDDDLLEGRAVRPAHRVAEERPERDALLRRVGERKRRGGRRVERLPQRRGAGLHISAAAVTRRVDAVQTLSELRAQVLVDVLVPAVAVR